MNAPKGTVEPAINEALRRFEMFGVRRDHRKWNMKDLTHTWTGYGDLRAYQTI